MAYSYRNLASFLAVLAVVSIVRAQNAPPGEIELHFTVFGERVPAVPLEFVVGNRYLPLAFYSAQRSSAYAYKGEAIVRFYSAGDHSNPAAIFAVPEKLRHALLLFIPAARAAANAPETFSVIGVDDSAEHTPPGHFVFLNISGRSYSAHYGEKIFAVPAGLSDAYPAAKHKYLKLVGDLDGKAVSVGGIQFGLAPGQRAILVLFPPAQASGLQPLIRTLYEETEPENAKPVAHPRKK